MLKIPGSSGFVLSNPLPPLYERQPQKNKLLSQKLRDNDFKNKKQLLFLKI